MPSGINRNVLVSAFPCHFVGEDSRQRGLANDSNLFVGVHQCPPHSECMDWPEGPFHGIVSFDNIFSAVIVVFQTITLEGWSGIFYLVRKMGVWHCLWGVVIICGRGLEAWSSRKTGWVGIVLWGVVIVGVAIVGCGQCLWVWS